MTRIVYTTYRQGPSGPPPNLLARIVTGVAAGVLLVASTFLGLFIFVAVLGVLAVAGAVVAVRLWFFRRRVEAAVRQAEAPPEAKPDYIDVEFEERDER